MCKRPTFTRRQFVNCRAQFVAQLAHVIRGQVRSPRKKRTISNGQPAAIGRRVGGYFWGSLKNRGYAGYMGYARRGALTGGRLHVTRFCGKRNPVTRRGITGSG